MKHSTHSRNTRALTLVELLIALAITAILLGLYLLPVISPNPPAYGIHCLSNLKQVGLAFRIYAGDNNDRFPMQLLTNKSGEPLYTTSADEFRYFQHMSNELSNPQVLFCGADKKRRAATNFTSDFNSAHISYFLGLDATEDPGVPQGGINSPEHLTTKYNPNAFLAGDANLTNGISPKNGLMEVTTANPANWPKEPHKTFGNVLRCDGSVTCLNKMTLPIAFQKTGLATNRLLLPP